MGHTPTCSNLLQSLPSPTSFPRLLTLRKVAVCHDNHSPWFQRRVCPCPLQYCISASEAHGEQLYSAVFSDLENMAASELSPRGSLDGIASRPTLRSPALSAAGPAVLQSPKSPLSPSQARHQRFVLPDPVAFSYLEEDPSTTVLERSRNLEGYQIYVVEQWACSRTHPTFLITAFTGDFSHTIKVAVLSVPADEESWSPRLRVYFKTLAQYYARRKDTPLGALMVTNLSTFPSSLTIVLVPDGDLRKHREDFFVSENLKRLGCSGRVGLSIAPPTLPTQAKFHQLYRVSDRIDFYSSVIELVKLCQVALMLFGCLGPEYCDGLLCDVTERAVNDWWLRIGTDLYSVEPSDGVLGHTTVAGLLGTLLGARNRLNAWGAPVAKDVFDIDTTKKAISAFQKTQHLPRTRRLDRITLDRLHKATAKQASGGDGWAVPRAVKSTVAELSGKGGEMVMEMVGKGEKTSIAEVETTNIDRFSQLVKGERARWLWHGKSRKRTTRDLFDTKQEGKSLEARNHRNADAVEDATEVEATKDRDDQVRQTLAPPDRQVAGEGNSDSFRDAKETTFNKTKSRIIGAVGMRGHQRDPPRNASWLNLKDNKSNKSLESLESARDDAASPRGSEDNARIPRNEKSTMKTDFTKNTPTSRVGRHKDIMAALPNENVELREPFEYQEGRSNRRSTAAIPSSTASIADELDRALPEDEREASHVSRLLRRTMSSDHFGPKRPHGLVDGVWPRQLSFSVAEEAMHRHGPWGQPASQNEDQSMTPASRHLDLKVALAQENLHADHARRLRARITALEVKTGHLVVAAVAEVENLDTMAAQDVEQLHSIYYPRRDDYQALQDGSREIVAEERSRLQEGMKDVETLGAQLEYEIGALRDKVEDVEGAVEEFEKQVRYTEGRVEDLVGTTAERDGWLIWAKRKLLRVPETSAKAQTRHNN